MQQPNRLKSELNYLHLLSLLSLCILMFIVFADSAVAQSGRKVPKRTEPINPVQPAPPEPERETPEPPEEKPTLPQIEVLVVTDRSNLNLPTGLANYVAGNCVQRLKQSSRLSVSVGKEMNRKEATDQAKSEHERFVAWIQVESDRTDFNSPSIQDIRIDYVVFSPMDAKVKTQGRVYLRPAQASVGGIGIPLPRTADPRRQIEASLQQAGIETADRIMSGLNIAILPPVRH